MTSKVFAPAKINLTLHVTGQRNDGYHLLDSLVVFADLGDRLWFTPQDHLSLKVTGPFADGVPADERNLVWKAAKSVGHTAAITLEKNLPHGAGIGGGSSDAAAVLRHFGKGENAALLGADVPVCLAGRAQRMQGVGDELTGVLGLPALHAVLVHPGVHVPTPEVFKALKDNQNSAMSKVLPSPETTLDFIDWLSSQRNDLEVPAVSAAPEIKSALDAINRCAGTMLSRMSGSGSTCFGLFENSTDAQQAARSIGTAQSHWWVRSCVLT